MTREEAIKIVKEFINGTCLHLVDQEALETLIPELKESEDEKTRKELISFLQLPHPQFVGNRKQDKWIAYLEKQKKPDDAWTEEDDAKVTAMCEEGDLKPSERAWLKELKNRIVKKEQKEQKPLEYLSKEKVYHIVSELANLSLNGIIPIESEGYTKIVEIKSNVLKLLDYPIEKKQEQKPETKLTGWVARDSEHNPYFGLGLTLFNEKPKRSGDCWSGAIFSPLPWNLFPDLKWEDEPIEVEVTIRKK